VIFAEEKNIRKGEKHKKLTTGNPSRSKQEVQKHKYLSSLILLQIIQQNSNITISRKPKIS